MKCSYAGQILNIIAFSFLLLATMAGCTHPGRLSQIKSFDPGSDKALILISVKYMSSKLTSQEPEWREYDPQMQKLIPGGETFTMRSTRESIDRGGDLFGFVVDPGNYIMVGVYEARCKVSCKSKTTMLYTGVASLPLIPMTNVDVKLWFNPKIEFQVVEGFLHPGGDIVIPEDASTEESDSWRVSVREGEIVYLGEYIYVGHKDGWRRTVTNLQSLIDRYDQISGTVVYRSPRQSDGGVTNTQ